MRRALVVLTSVVVLLGAGAGGAMASDVRPVNETLSAGFSHTCAIVSTGLQCAGENNNGELGDGDVEEFGFTATPNPVDVEGFSGRAKAVAAGLGHTCALSADGFARCWGNNFYGQLGTGDRVGSPTPRTAIGGLVSIDLGNSHTCAVTAGGAALCWGLNEYGEIGNGQPACQSKCFAIHPEEVRGLSGVVHQLALGDGFSCAVNRAGVVWCWGNGYGPAPVGIPGLRNDVVAISAGIHHACALTQAGAVKCWGGDEFGELGDDKHGVGLTSRRAVTAVPGAVAAIAAGGNHTCAVTRRGSAMCWGRNDYGELGDGTDNNRDEFVLVKGIGIGSGVTEISVGYQFSCARFDGDKIKCWGKNDVGQLGNGTTEARRTPADTNFGGPSVSFLVHEKGRQALKGKGHRFELTSVTGFGTVWLDRVPEVDARVVSGTGRIRIHRWRIFAHGAVDQDDFTVEVIGPPASFERSSTHLDINRLRVRVTKSDPNANDECRRGDKGTITLRDHQANLDLVDIDVCNFDRKFRPRKAKGINIRANVAMALHSRPAAQSRYATAAAS